jgi:hypothetical protein
MKKRRFTYSERYAVWHCHGQRCWLCTEPLRLVDTTIDHFFPESLLSNKALRIKALSEYGLDDNFDINGFENWLPCHGRCNQTKGNKTFEFIPGNMVVLGRLIKLAPKVKRTALEVSSNITKDKVFGRLFAALERETISTEDLRELLGKFVEAPAPKAIPEDVLLLDGGYWVFRNEVAREGECQCERNRCVDSPGKVYCYFRPDSPQWVITTGLYWKCYDEIVQCPRCSSQHKRGHIGKDGVCGKPYRDQESQTD